MLYLNSNMSQRVKGYDSFIFDLIESVKKIPMENIAQKEYVVEKLRMLQRDVHKDMERLEKFIKAVPTVVQADARKVVDEYPDSLTF